MLARALYGLFFIGVFSPPADHAPDRTLDGRNFALVGVGTSKESGFEIALYVDELDARRAFPALVARVGGRSHRLLTAGDHAPTFLLWGHFGKLAVLRFSKAYDGAALRTLMQEPLAAELANVPAVVKEASDNYLALFEPGVKSGDEISLRTWDDGRIEVEIGGVKHAAPQSPKLARAIWNTWLGPKAADADLRRGMIDKIDVLGR
jgi:hypothetical protein